MSSPNRTHTTGRRRVSVRLLGERGAAAVEFALVVPVLLLLLMGIIEFSKAFHTQSTLSAAAREGARVMALGNNAAGARDAVRAAADPLAVTNAEISIVPSTCTGAAKYQQVTVTVRHHQSFMSSVLDGAGFDLTGKAVMRCGG